MRLALAFLSLLTVFLASAASADAPLRVQLTWTHQAQFAGLYVAETKGYYRHEELDVELIEGGPGVVPAAAVAAGEADVAIAWLSDALEVRKAGHDIVNIAQLLQHPGMLLMCRNDAGIESVGDIAGKRIGYWGVGDEFSLGAFLRDLGLAAGDVELVKQAPQGADLIAGHVDCATVMVYNEYWSILAAGFSPTDFFMVDFGEGGQGVLEDGLYVSGAALADPVTRDRLVRFLRATARGWAHAQRHPDDALAMVMAKNPGLSEAHQARMLRSVLRLVEPARHFGLLDLDGFRDSVAVIGGTEDADALAATARHAWTLRLWRDAGLDPETHRPLTRTTEHYLAQAADTAWFYIFVVLGTAAFATAGFMQAQKRHYDLWGAFVLAFLPAVGGGTIRDLLLGGDRHPPFIFKDPIYIYTVLAVVGIGALLSWLMPNRIAETRSYTRVMRILDSLGLATFAIVGAKVAMLAGLDWYWAAFCAALSCAGGGMLLDIVTGKEPRTFTGEPYEEVAIAGGLFFFFWLKMVNHYEHGLELVYIGMIVTLVLTFTLRMVCSLAGIRSFRLGRKSEVPSNVS